MGRAQLNAVLEHERSWESDCARTRALIETRGSHGSTTMAQHLLIASATWKYKDSKDDRPILSEVLKDVVHLFTKKLGVYTRELLVIGENPKASDLRAYLDQWFADPRRDPEDWIVFYYTGHAEIVGADSLYLLTTDFVNGLHVSTD